MALPTDMSSVVVCTIVDIDLGECIEDVFYVFIMVHV